MTFKRTCLLLSALAGLMLLASLVSPRVALAFTDVDSSVAYNESIEDLSARGIVSGYPDDSFRPGERVKRMHFTKIMARALVLPVSTLDICPFVDVPTGLDTADDLYPDHYIAACYKYHITEGTNREEKLFAPASPIRRAQVMSMVVRAADDLHPGWLDAPPEGYQPTWGNFDQTHSGNAAKAEFNGLLAGLPLAVLDPFAYMSRGEVSQVVHNLLVALENDGMCVSQKAVEITVAADGPLQLVGPYASATVQADGTVSLDLPIGLALVLAERGGTPLFAALKAPGFRSHGFNPRGIERVPKRRPSSLVGLLEGSQIGRPPRTGMQSLSYNLVRRGQIGEQRQVQQY